MDKLFYIFVYFLVGLYVAHFFVQEFDHMDIFDGVGTIIILATAFVFWPLFMIIWAAVAIKEMHKRL